MASTHTAVTARAVTTDHEGTRGAGDTRSIVVVRQTQSGARPRRPLRQRLRGCGGWLTLAAGLGAAAGVVAAVLAWPPWFEATAVLAVEPAAGRAIPAERIDALTEQVMQTLTSPAVVQAAGPLQREDLVVERDARARRQIRVRYRAKDHASASATSGRVVDAGVAASELFGHEATVQQIESLREQMAQEQARHKELQALQRQAREAFGMLPLDTRIHDRRRELDRLTVQARELELTLESAGDEPEATSPGTTAASDTQPVSAWRTVAKEIARAWPVPPARVSVVDLDGEPVAPMTRGQLEARLQGLRQMHGTVSGELGDLIAKAATVNTLDRKVAEAAAAVDLSQARVEELASSNAAAARLWVLDRGEAVALAEPGRYAAMVGGAGAAGAATLLWLTALGLASDRRLRRAAMVQAGPDDPPVLGAVPMLTTSGSDAQTQQLAQAVHEMRSILEIHADRHGARVFALVSPRRGAGRTSLTVGLGTSLAMSGSRTLLIDLDVATRAGDMPAGHQTIEQVMREMGYVAASERALVRRGGATGRGLAGMLEGASLEECVIRTKVSRLDVLHAHAVAPEQVGRLSGRFVAKVASAARRAYDMVLIDAGPVPGSVEGMLASAKADGVVIVVPRNLPQRTYDRCLRQLQLAEAKVIGTVFNRASLKDVAMPEGMQASAERRSSLGASSRAAVGTGSGIFAAAVQARAGSAFDRSESVTPGQITPAPDLDPAPQLDDDAVAVAAAPTPAPGSSPDDTGEWDTDLEASLDQLVDEVSQSPRHG